MEIHCIGRIPDGTALWTIETDDGHESTWLSSSELMDKITYFLNRKDFDNEQKE